MQQHQLAGFAVDLLVVVAQKQILMIRPYMTLLMETYR
jgi:hypothetical protein